MKPIALFLLAIFIAPATVVLNTPDPNSGFFDGHLAYYLNRRSRNQTGPESEKLDPSVKCHQRPVNIGCSAYRKEFSARNMQNPDG